MAKSIKDKVKAKAKAVKDKAKAVKDKLKGAAKGAALVVAFSAVAGCMTPEQASRSTSAGYGDIEPAVKVEAVGSNTVSVAVHITFGDGAIASADSSGSTESQTQTPTFDISPKTDLRYNDAIAGASAASKEILGTLGTAGLNKVLALMESGGSGQVTVERKDGTQAVVTCDKGQCTSCTDCAK